MNNWQWWAARRKQYNIGLVIAGMLAFAGYVSVVMIFEHRIPNADITAFTTLFQGLCYLIMIGVANICYFVGPISEKILKPKNVSQYRAVTFSLGYWLSMSLPFIIPAILLALVISQPVWWVEAP